MAFILSILISLFWKGLWANGWFKKTMFELANVFFHLLFSASPSLPAFCSLSSFCVPLALQAVVCFLPLMCFFFEQPVKKEKKPSKSYWYRNHVKCVCFCMHMCWLYVVAPHVCCMCYMFKCACVCMGTLALNLLRSRCSNYRTALLPNDRKLWPRACIVCAFYCAWCVRACMWMCLYMCVFFCICTLCVCVWLCACVRALAWVFASVVCVSVCVRACVSDWKCVRQTRKLNSPH